MDRLGRRHRSHCSSSRSSSSSRRSASCRSSTRWVVERLGRFYAVLEPGLNFVIPFVDRVAYRHDLREIPLDVPSQICITRDNTQLQVDGILYFQVTDPKLASYGSSQLTCSRSRSSRRRRCAASSAAWSSTRRSRSATRSTSLVVAALDQAAASWGVKVLRYEIKDLTPPKEILRSMQAQITAEREKRAVIATSEGPAAGADQRRRSARARRRSPSRKARSRPRSTTRRARRRRTLAIAEANAKAIRQVAEAIEAPGGLQRGEPARSRSTTSPRSRISRRPTTR